MSIQQFYRRMLLLPFVVPILAFVVGIVFAPQQQWLGDSLGVLIVGGVASCIPYGIFAAIVAFRIGGWTTTTIRKVQWFAPLICLGLFIGADWALALIRGRSNGGLFSDSTAFFAFYVLSIGYFYVLLIEILRAVAIRKHWLVMPSVTST